MTNVAAFVIKLIISLVIFLSFIVGFHRHVVPVQENACHMTYMFEYPQYIRITLDAKTRGSFPRYGLYVYGEGGHADKYYRSQFSGIPILFIPGNAGSHKQVRSLASVAYRKALDSHKHRHFDFFAADFDEEFSALYGGVLISQAAFVQKCIDRILFLYQDKRDAPDSVILIGHSMGGMVAKGLFTLHGFDGHKVSTIITLATPHSGPVVAFDEHLATFYEDVNRVWALSGNKTSHVTLASIGGADRDIQVRSDLTVAGGASVDVLVIRSGEGDMVLDSSDGIFHLQTTEVAGVWQGVDHLCMAWCKQVVLTVVRSLFDIVDQSTQQIVREPTRRNEVLSYHLVKRYAGKHFKSHSGSQMVAFDPDGKWREVISAKMTVRRDDDFNTYFMIPLVDNPLREHLAAVASHLTVSHWVFGCIASAWRNNVRFCEKGIDLSEQTVLLPATGDDTKRKLIELDLAELRAAGLTHVVFNIPRKYSKGTVQYEVHRSTDRMTALNIWPTVSTEVNIGADNLVHNISLVDFTRAWQSLEVIADGSNCRANGLLRKEVPWSREGEFFLTNVTASIHLHAPRRPQVGGPESVQLQLINPHGCRFRIKIVSHYAGMWSQIVKFYGIAILPMICAIFLDCFSRQLKAKALEHPVPSTLTCLLSMSCLKMVFVPQIVAGMLCYIESSCLETWPFPASDLLRLTRKGLDWPAMYFLLGSTAWIVSIALNVIFWLAIFVSGSTFNALAIRYIRRGFGFSSIIAELLTMGLFKFPVAISALLIVIAASTCGSLAMLLGFVLCVWKLFGYYEDQLEAFFSFDGALKAVLKGAVPENSAGVVETGGEQVDAVTVETGDETVEANCEPVVEKDGQVDTEMERENQQDDEVEGSVDQAEGLEVQNEEINQVDEEAEEESEEINEREGKLSERANRMEKLEELQVLLDAVQDLKLETEERTEAAEEIKEEASDQVKLEDQKAHVDGQNLGGENATEDDKDQVEADLLNGVDRVEDLKLETEERTETAEEIKEEELQDSDRVEAEDQNLLGENAVEEDSEDEVQVEDQKAEDGGQNLGGANAAEEDTEGDKDKVQVEDQKAQHDGQNLAGQNASEEDNDEDDKDESDLFHINTTITLLWICTTLLCLPTLAVWIKCSGSTVANDPTFSTSVLWSTFGMIVWRKWQFSNKGLLSYNGAAKLISLISILQLVYGLWSTYRIKYFTSAAIAVYIFTQIF